MSRKRLLISGGSGFLGWHLASEFAREYEVAFTYSSHRISIPNCQGFSLDVRRSYTIRDCLNRFNPDTVIHAAALADTGVCQKNPELAYAVNVEGTRRILDSIPNPHARFIYISTDLVFGGEHQPYREKDETHPVSVYGATKREAERLVLNYRPNSIILRAALMYGKSNPLGKGSFIQWMDEALRRGEPLTLFADEYRTPTYVGDVCCAVRAILKDEIGRRIYHLGGPERISRVEFGKRLAVLRGYDVSLIHEATLAQAGLAGRRARDVSFDSGLIQRSYLLHWTPIDRALKIIFDL